MRLKNEKGQSLVEMALLLPILLLLLVGVIDFGRLLYTNMHLQLATQETVRLAGLGASDQQLRDFVYDYTHVKNKQELVVTITPNQNQRNSGGYVTVSIVYPMDIMTPFVSKLLSLPITVETESTIRIE